MATRLIDELMANPALEVDEPVRTTDPPMLSLQVTRGAAAVGAAPEPVPPPQYVDEDDVPPRGPGLEGIVPGSGRVHIPDTSPVPWRSICHLEVIYDQLPYTATGFLVDAGLVLTSAHVVWHPELRKIAHTVKVYPARQSQVGIRMEQTSQTVRFHENWKASPTAEFDYGAVLLPDRRMFQPFLTFPLKSLSDGELSTMVNQGARVVVAGYPFEQPYGTMWGGAGGIRNFGDRTLRHLCSTTPGQSGSPVYGINQHGQYVAIGVHSKEAETQPLPSNIACRVTQKMMRDVERWKSESTSLA